MIFEEGKGTFFDEKFYEDHYNSLKKGLNKHWIVQYKNVTELVKPNEKDVILDIGCGTGKYEAKYSHLVKNIIGVEVKDYIIKWARKLSEGEGREGHYEFTKDIGKVSGVTKVMMIDVIEHLPRTVFVDYLKKFKEFEAEIFIYTPNRYYWLELVRKDSSHISLNALKELKRLLGQEGYYVEESYYRYSHIPILNLIERIMPIVFLKRRLCIKAIPLVSKE